MSTVYRVEGHHLGGLGSWFWAYSGQFADLADARRIALALPEESRILRITTEEVERYDHEPKRLVWAAPVPTPEG